MIQTQQGLEQTKELITSLRRARDQIFERNEGTPFMMHLSAVGFERMMSQLLVEVEEYESRNCVRPHDDGNTLVPSQLAETEPAPAGRLDAG